MTEDNRTNIKIDDDVHERHNQKRQELGLSWTEYMRRLEWDNGDTSAAIDSDEVARKVAERLEGSKPLAEMEFDDWFKPDYAKTIATHIESEIMLSEVGVDYSPVINRIDDLESQLPKKVANEIPTQQY